MDVGEGRVIPAVPGWRIAVFEKPGARPVEWPVIGWRVFKLGVAQPVTPFGSPPMGVWAGRVTVYTTPGGALMDHYGRDWRSDEHEDMFRALWRDCSWDAGPPPEEWGLKP